MANKLLVLGESGSGKSRAIKDLDPKTTAIINVINKPLPFQGWMKNYKKFTGTDGNMLLSYSHDKILKFMDYVNTKMPSVKTLVIDDAQYVMSYEFMERSSERGFDKFTEIGKHMFDILRKPDTMRDDLTVFFLSHSEDISANGYTRTKMKTIGKLLDDKITIEGLFTVVLLTSILKRKEGVDYNFITGSDGTTTAKSPEGMFPESRIPNDLKYVLEQINKYNEGE